MPVALLFIGALFLVSAVRGQASIDEMTTLIKQDFSGPGNFFVWALAFGAVASIAYIPNPQAKKFSNAFLALIVIAILIGKKGPTGKDFFTSFFQQIRSTERAS